ncbi:hypothetical protein Swoo_2840 [Shewanella woodyi ATCC 51908]|uniref:Uncharacterized protein n=1 Tax=Shewanella woodyi (strain ATCC 51908 / MS32) TaxID=392500 RepID=B1KJS8_SHEWM|nr:hypothetical protein Swoo_2840 [Shewanella woodyi ATCC 51908]
MSVRTKSNKKIIHLSLLPFFRHFIVFITDKASFVAIAMNFNLASLLLITVNMYHETFNTVDFVVSGLLLLSNLSVSFYMINSLI